MKSQRNVRGHGERVLFVDDEEPLVALVTHLLEKLGYKVTGYTNPEKALETFRSQPQEFDVVVSDLSMPGMSGIDLARAMLAIRPGIPILMSSGCIRDIDSEQVRSLGLPDLILKPDAVEKLGHRLHDLFAGREKPGDSEDSPGTKKANRRAAGAGSGS